MAYEMNDNSGSLFANDKRESDRHPNAKGSALIDGVEYWVSAWTKTAKSGQRYQSLAFQRKDQQQRDNGGWSGRAPDGSRGGPPDSGGYADDLDDEIPF